MRCKHKNVTVEMIGNMSLMLTRSQSNLPEQKPDVMLGTVENAFYRGRAFVDCKDCGLSKMYSPGERPKWLRDMFNSAAFDLAVRWQTGG